MQKNTLYLITFFFLSGLLFKPSLASQNENKSDTATSGIATSDIVATIKPLHALVSLVIGESKKVGLLLSGDESAHHFQLKPSQIKTLTQSKLLFYIDDSFETFLTKPIKRLNINAFAMTKAKNLTLLNLRDDDNFKHGHQHSSSGHQSTHGDHEDDHESEYHESEHHENEHHENKHHEDEHHENEHHEDDYKSEHHESEHHESEHHESELTGEHLQSLDSHIWLDTDNAKKMLMHIVEILSDYAPENKKIYQKNAQAAITKITALDNKIKQQLSTVKDHPFIVFHDAYQYFERRYQLNALGSLTLEPDESPKARRLLNIIQQIKQSTALCVFTEPQFSKRLIDSVNVSGNIKMTMLDPLGAYLTPSKNLYFTLLENMAANFNQCLEKANP